jgi:hypothetical protein
MADIIEAISTNDIKKSTLVVSVYPRVGEVGTLNTYIKILQS